jgi:Flp pilus assembly protein TadG
MLIKCRRAVVMAEFALLLPLLIVGFMGSIQFGSLLFTYNMMQTAARNSSRALAVGSLNPEQAATAVRAALPGWVSADAVTVSVEPVGADEIRTQIDIASEEAMIFRLVPMTTDTISVAAVMTLEETAVAAGDDDDDDDDDDDLEDD